ncbi:MAG TPA: sigma-70 family RNA polymerase sigma factor, partial [Phycisphaerales bacterium]|nr:sigma-70 family RNA polymerase sigma factor [Phycisphaerales bacterium]
ERFGGYHTPYWIGRAGGVRRRSLRDIRSSTADDGMSTSPPAASETLLGRTARGDSAAMRECIDVYGGLVWSIARRLMFTDAEAEDAVQEVFLEVWKHSARFDPSIASETAFIAMIARRRMIDRRRRASRDMVREPLADDAAISTRDPSVPSERSDDANKAVAALGQLSEEQQNVLRLSIYQGLSHERIARAIGLPLGTVKTHARRGLLKLRSLLDAGGSTPPVGVEGAA